MLFVGIDVAKSKHDCCIIDSKNLSNVKIGLESTGHYSTNITNYLYSKGFQVHILNPLATNLFRKAGTLRKTKTDKTDAKVIATMLAEIGDIERFSTPAKLLAFARMEPSTYQSENYNASNTHMVKRGSTYLRWAVMQAARLVSMRDTTFATYMAKKRSEGKHFNVAKSHVWKKLLRVIFYLLKNNTAFVPQV